MSTRSYQPRPPTDAKRESSFAYELYLRSQRIYGLCASTEHPELTAVDTAVLLAMNHHSKPDGTGMRPSTQTVALMTNLSRRSIVRSLARLTQYGLLVAEDRQRSRAVVCYRFGESLLTGSGSLREMLERKLMDLWAKRNLAPRSPASGAIQSRAPLPGRAPESMCIRHGVTPPAPACPPAVARQTPARDPVSHRTDLEPFSEPTIEPIQKLSAIDEGASRPFAGAPHRLAISDRRVEDIPNIPESEDELQEFFRTAFANK